MLSASKSLIAPRTGYPPVKWCSTGGIGGWASAGPGSWSHFIPNEANAVVVALLTHNNGLAIGPISGYVGNSNYPLRLISVSPDYHAGGYNGYVYLLGCLNPPKGQVTVTISSNPSSYTCATSMAYSGVGSFAPVKGVIGLSGTNPYTVVNAPAGQMVVTAIGSYTDNPPPMNLTATVRASLPPVGGINNAMTVGDAMSPGTPMTFAATLANNQNWGMVSARLVPQGVALPSPTKATMEFWGTGGITSAWTENHFWVPTLPDSVVAEGEWLRNPYDQPVVMVGSMDFSGTAGTGAKGDYGPFTGVGIFERGDTVNANGLGYTQIQGPGAGTVSFTYNGFIEAGRWFTAKIFESNVGGYGVYYHGTFSINPLGTGW